MTVRGLVKHYGETKALDGVDLEVREGTVMGVLGPNGAGKTTLVRILSTLLAPDSGQATVAGYDVVRQPRQLRRVIGLTGQYASVDENLTATENLVLFGRLLGMSGKAARAASGRWPGCWSGNTTWHVPRAVRRRPSRRPRPARGPHCRAF